MYKLYVYCPDETDLIQRIISAAADAGAGVVGHYSRRTLNGSSLYQRKSSDTSYADVTDTETMAYPLEVKIEMICAPEPLAGVVQAIRDTHPYEEPAIDIIKLKQND